MGTRMGTRERAYALNLKETSLSKQCPDDIPGTRPTLYLCVECVNCAMQKSKLTITMQHIYRPATKCGSKLRDIAAYRRPTAVKSRLAGARPPGAVVCRFHECCSGGRRIERRPHGCWVGLFFDGDPVRVRLGVAAAAGDAGEPVIWDQAQHHFPVLFPGSLGAPDEGQGGHLSVAFRELDDVVV